MPMCVSVCMPQTQGKGEIMRATEDAILRQDSCPRVFFHCSQVYLFELICLRAMLMYHLALPHVFHSDIVSININQVISGNKFLQDSGHFLLVFMGQ